ncbi:MAG: alpha/beta hydrolase [Rhizobiaceae bacterium]
MKFWVQYWNGSANRRTLIWAGILILGSGFLSGCATVPHEIFGIDNDQTPAATVNGARQQRIFIATTRQPAKTRAAFYTGERGETLSFASVDVSIPPNHQVGSLEIAKRLPPDPRKEFVVLNPQKYDASSGFVQQIDRELNKREVSDRTILVFVHGYNTKLSSAVLRAAQFAEDANYTGVTVLFSWASRGRTVDYVYDLNSALHARDDLLRTGNVLSGTKATGYDILAHSMGNLLTVEAFVKAQLRGRFNRGNRIRNIILASPDIDIDVFKKQMAVFPKNERNFFVLISRDDKALLVSRRLAGGVNRVGAGSADELAALGVTVIDLSEVDDKGSLSHSKFADSPEIVQLIGQRIDKGQKFDTGQPQTEIPLLGDLGATISSIASGGRVISIRQ